MSDIFISYARSTARQASQIAQALSALGYGVWRDSALPAHRPYAEVIEERLKDAKAVLVIWSAAATRSEWVRSEADRARLDHKLVQVSVDGAPLPMPFDQIHCADLSSWSADADTHDWRTVIASLDELINRGSALAGAEDAPATSPGERPTLPLPAKPSIAVLPFKNLSGDPAQEYFADGITEDIVTALSRWRWFFVIARHSSFTYKGHDVGAERVGDELGVRYILEGSVRTSGRKVRVSVQLVDASSGSHVWAERYDRELVDVLALQDEITAEVVAAIEPAMLQGEGLRVARRGPTDFTALDCFYRGMWRLNNLTEDADAEALALFREAVRRDPTFALGHVGVARALYGKAIFGASSRPLPTLRAARAAAQRAIALDPREAYGYFAAAGASLYLGDHAAALEEAQQAVELNANFAYGQYRLGQVLLFAGRPAEAIAPIEKSLRLSPYDPQRGLMLETLALAHYQAGGYAKAVGCAEAAVRLTGSGSAVLAASLARLQRSDEAAQAFARVRGAKRSPKRPLAAPYADRAQLDNLRDGFRLAGHIRQAEAAAP